MDRVSSTSTNPLAGSAEGGPVASLADMKPQPQQKLKPQPQPRTQPKPGTAADLGRWSFVTELRGAGNFGPKVRTSIMRIEQTATVKVDPMTTLKVSGQVTGYNAGRNGAGIDYRAAVNVNRTLSITPGATYTAGVTAGVNLNQQQRPLRIDNGSIDVALNVKGEWKTDSRTSFFAEGSLMQSFAATKQARGRLTVGATWKPDPSTVVAAYVAGEIRQNQNGSRAGEVTSVIRQVGVDASFKVGEKVEVVLNAVNTSGGPGSGPTPGLNDGTSAGFAVKFKF